MLGDKMTVESLEKKVMEIELIENLYQTFNKTRDGIKTNISFEFNLREVDDYLSET